MTTFRCCCVVVVDVAKLVCLLLSGFAFFEAEEFDVGPNAIGVPRLNAYKPSATRSSEVESILVLFKYQIFLWSGDGCPIQSA